MITLKVLSLAEASLVIQAGIADHRNCLSQHNLCC
jgi:hypothetical protein